MREYGFELALCATLEQSRTDSLVSRQIGAAVATPGNRIADIVCVEAGEEFDRRAAITAETIPDSLLDAQIGPGGWTPVSTLSESAQRAVDRGVEIGYLEQTYRGGRWLVRSVCRYPDWFADLLLIENKPTLDRPGALMDQVQLDASLAVVDRVVVATADYVTGAHLNRLPEAVGVWRIHDTPTQPRIEVVRSPQHLATQSPGIEPMAKHAGRTDIAIVSPAAKERARRRIAERAYGKGWRRHLPACDECDPEASPLEATVPWCQWASRIVDPARDCGPECSGHSPGDGPPSSLDQERAERTLWRHNPSGLQRRQAGFSTFRSE
ncbi:MAG: DUF5787 family protein [Natrialbaceae archaeon]|nr:DUF5787 family protein [Natrialbaceae archaeon]